MCETRDRTPLIIYHEVNVFLLRVYCLFLIVFYGDSDAEAGGFFIFAIENETEFVVEF